MGQRASAMVKRTAVSLRCGESDAILRSSLAAALLLAERWFESKQRLPGRDF